jgi:histone-lysine N-methyltransferase SETMAR
MLIVFWGIRGITHYCWLPEDSTSDSSFSCEEVPGPIAEKLHANSSKTRKPFTSIHMDNARVHTAHVTQQKLEVSGLKRAPQPPYSPDIAPSDFFLFAWLKTELERREYEGEDELYEVVDEILAGLSIEMIEAVFGKWMDRLERVITGNGDYISLTITLIFFEPSKIRQSCSDKALIDTLYHTHLTSRHLIVFSSIILKIISKKCLFHHMRNYKHRFIKY